MFETLSWFSTIQNFLTPLADWHVFGGMALGAALGAAAWYSPIFKMPLLAAAVVCGTNPFSYWTGDFNGAQRVQAKWDQSVVAERQRVDDARAAALRDVANGVRDKRDTSRPEKDRLPAVEAKPKVRRGKASAGNGA